MKTMKKWLEDWGNGTYVGDPYYELARRIDGLDGLGNAVAAIQNELRGFAERVAALEDDGKTHRAFLEDVFLRLRKLEQFSSSVIKVEPKPEPQGVYVREGMRVKTPSGCTVTVRRWPAARPPDGIAVWHDDGAGELFRFNTVFLSYNGKPVLGYEEDRP